MNIPDPKALANVAKTLQNGGPENTLTAPPALPVPGAFEFNNAPWISQSIENINPMTELFRPAGFTKDIKDWTVSDDEKFEKEALARAEALKMEFPPTPFDVDMSKWDLSRITEESLAVARKQLDDLAPPDDSPSGP